MPNNTSSGVSSGPTLSNGVNGGARAHVPLEEKSQEFRAIVDAIRSTTFGEVTVIVQDGYVVQVNRLEKRRLR